MKQNIIIKSLLIAASFAGLVATTRAQETVSTPPAGTLGLLGQTYAGLTYNYINLDGTSTNAQSYGFEYNQALNSGLDAILTYDWAQTDRVAGSRLRNQTLGGALRAFSTSYSWGKPYVEAGLGYVWSKYAGSREDSYVWEVAVGSEFQLAPQFTVTPYVQYVDAPDLGGSGAWNFGAKGNYWVTSQWAVTAGVSIDDDKNTEYTIGTNFRF